MLFSSAVVSSGKGLVSINSFQSLNTACPLKRGCGSCPGLGAAQGSPVTGD